MTLTPLTKPEVGQGITYAINGDSYPYTIREISPSGHRFTATADKFRPKPGANEPYSERAKIGVYEPDENGKRETFARRRDGFYQPIGKRFVRVYLGREYKQDPSF